MTGHTNRSSMMLLLAGAVWLIALTACSDDAERTVRPPRSEQLVRLSSGITPSTRSSLNAFSGETIAFAQGYASGVYRQMWQAVAEETDTRLVDDHLYPADGSRLYLRGYYPPNPIADGCTVYRLDGQTDLMATAEKSGNIKDNFSLPDKTFLFYHLLAQVNFAVRLTTAEGAEGIRLSAVYLRGSRQEATMRLSEAPPEQLPEVLFGGEANPYTAYIEPSRYGGILLSTKAVALPLALLVEPGTPLTLDVRLSLSPTETKEYKGLAIRFDELGGISRAGTAYLITVVIRPPGDPDGDPDGEVQLSASVQPWETGGTGSGSVGAESIKTLHAFY